MDDETRFLQMCQALVNAYPKPVMEAFEYCMAMMLVERGMAELVQKIPGDDGTICIIQNLAGDLLAVERPVISQDKEAMLLEVISEILRDAGL